MSYQPVSPSETPEPAIATEHPAEKKSFLSNLTEDWWAVIIGGVIITVVLLIAFFAGTFKFELPVYQWATSSDLFDKVLSLHNIILIGITGLVFLVLSSVAIVLSGGSSKKYAAGFALIFILGIIALIITDLSM